MIKIFKKTLCAPIDYAAQELKKYLRMMMTECGEIEISYAPDAEAKDGFVLGLMKDFGLDTSDVENTELDDIIYIDTEAEHGMIAGDNPRSVLIGVYEYLRQNGCRWLFPGVDGEFIPMVDSLKDVKLRHVPTCRFRGQCNEGGEFQSNMYEAIEFTPKVGMNVFMMEFRIPTSYYRRYYNHLSNEELRAPEPVSDSTILQWKRACECEIAKRGLQFHDMGHGWSADPFGIDSSLRKSDGDNESRVPPESRKYLALSRGSRSLVNGVPNYTQFCMSNAEAREKVVKYACDYAQKSTNVDYLHFWLGDAVNRHCECEECVKKTPSDWYMILLNELDEEMNKRKLSTKVVFIAYTDTIWAPEVERLKNPARFTLLCAPLSRKYTESLVSDKKDATVLPYVRNKCVMPKTPEQTLAYLDEWKKQWRGVNVAYEYHFWIHQYYDVSGTRLAEVVNEDVRVYKKIDINGMIQDGSQRSFFPTGYTFYTYARTMYDSTLTAEELAEEYFSCAFGEDWKKFYGYLKGMGELFGFEYLEGLDSADIERGKYYNPSLVERFKKVRAYAQEGRELIRSHYNMPYRVQTVSVRLLEFHALYCELLADALIAKCCGKDDEADELYKKMRIECGRWETYFESCYDHALAFHALESIFKTRTKSTEPEIY